MRNPAKLRAIYLELRNATGGEMPSGDLLRLAHHILRAYALEEDDSDPLGFPVSSRAFLTLPVDSAMRDGGWRVLSFESRRAANVEDLEPEELVTLNTDLTRLLGPRWRMVMQEG